MAACNDGKALNEALVLWLETQLQDERRLLELRHLALCDYLRERCASSEGFVAPDAAAAETAKAAETKRTKSRTVDTPQAKMREPAVREPAKLKAVTAVQQANSAPTSSSSQVSSAPGVSLRSIGSHAGRAVRKLTSSKMRGLQWRDHTHRMEHSQLNRLERILYGHMFELTFAILIIFNTVVMAAETQYRSSEAGDAIKFAEFTVLQQAGKGEDDASRRLSSDAGDQVFFVLDLVFGSVFLMEVFLKMLASHFRFVHSGWNIFDATVMAFWVFGLVSGSKAMVNPTLLRLMRLGRLMRLVRLVRVMEMFDTLSLMIGSLKACISVFVWGFALLFIIMTVCALALNNILSPAMKDDTLPMDVRKQLHNLFGSYTRAMITMFELTLASWVPVTRLLHDNVSQWYAPIIIMYKGVVGFAVLKVITGIFLHETFRCAQTDDSLLIQNRTRNKKLLKRKMTMLFAEADADHTGQVSKEEFLSVVTDDQVSTWLQAMDLYVRDPERLFEYLAGEDQALTVHELVTGVAKLKGPALALDVVTLLADVQRQQREAQFLVTKLHREFQDGIGVVSTVTGSLLSLQKIYQDGGMCQVNDASEFIVGVQPLRPPSEPHLPGNGMTPGSLIANGSNSGCIGGGMSFESHHTLPSGGGMSLEGQSARSYGGGISL